MKKTGLAVVLILLWLSNPCFSQTNSADTAKRRPAILQNGSIQAGLTIGMDAQAWYTGPGCWLALGYRLRPKIRLHMFAHAFSGRALEAGFADKLGMYSAGLMPQFYLGRKAGRGLYAGIGICYQIREEVSQGDFANNYQRRVNTLPAYNIGWQFPLKGKRLSLALELFGTGPYQETYTDGSYTELLTQLSLGGKIIF